MQLPRAISWMFFFSGALAIASADGSEPKPYVGAATCASFGCHGNGTAHEPWRSASLVWSRQDPHAHAADGLLGERGFAMLRKLVAIQRKKGDAPVSTTDATLKVDEASLVKLIAARCIACHASPPAASRRVGEASGAAWSTTQTMQSLRDNHLGGVSCESCHGAAGGWLAEHTTQRWSALSATDKESDWGFRNTADLSSRAALCIDCHVGPKVDDQQRIFRVDHDLIAAGHPRLSFEFPSFLRNYPAHWDREKDRRRVDGDSYQLTAWRYGNWHHVRALARDAFLQDSFIAQNAANDRDHEAAIDFAQYDCFRCHHRLAGRTTPSRPRPVSDLGREGFPPAEDTALVQLELMIGSSKSAGARTLLEPLGDFRTWLNGRWTERWTARPDEVVNTQAAVPERLLEVLQADESAWQQLPWTVADQIRTLAAFADHVATSEPPRWEPSVQLYLAVAAFIEDRQAMPSPPLAEVQRVHQQFGQLLTEIAGESGRNSIYQSPLRFIREETAWRTSVKSLADVLHAYAWHLSTTRNPAAPSTP